MASLKQVLANRLNALKSTGPKTSEGKARSRGNAIRHGLAGAGVALSETDARAFQKRVKEWEGEIAPQGRVETWLVRSAVAASIRVDRCQRAEWAELQRTRRETIQDWEGEQEERLKAILPDNSRNLRDAILYLEEFSAGCEWLASSWKILRGEFQAQGCFAPEALADMLCLLGLDPDKTGVEGTRENEFAKRNACAGGDGEGAPQAQQSLLSQMDQNIARLDRLAAGRWGMEEARWLNEDLDRAAFDATPRGQLLHRYETASRNEVIRCLNQITRIRKEDLLFPQPAPPVVVSASQLAQMAAAQEAASAAPKASAPLRNEANSAAASDGSLCESAACANASASPTGPRQTARRRVEVPGERKRAIEAEIKTRQA